MPDQPTAEQEEMERQRNAAPPQPRHLGLEGLSPAWLYRCRPEDFRGARCRLGDIGLDPAVGGWLCLFLVHWACVFPMMVAWNRHGFQAVQCLWLLPVVVLWAYLVPADVRFRRLGATREERKAFDLAFLEWFCWVSFALFSLVVVVVWPVSIIYFVLNALGCL